MDTNPPSMTLRGGNIVEVSWKKGWFCRLPGWQFWKAFGHKSFKDCATQAMAVWILNEYTWIHQPMTGHHTSMISSSDAARLSWWHTKSTPHLQTGRWPTLLPTLERWDSCRTQSLHASCIVWLIKNPLKTLIPSILQTWQVDNFQPFSRNCIRKTPTLQLRAKLRRLPRHLVISITHDPHQEPWQKATESSVAFMAVTVWPLKSSFDIFSHAHFNISFRKRHIFRSFFHRSMYT